MPGAEGARLWQAALVYLRASVPADAYGRVVRYAVALDLRRGHDVAVIGVPAEYMRAELKRRAGPSADLGAGAGVWAGAAGAASLADWAQGNRRLERDGTLNAGEMAQRVTN